MLKTLVPVDGSASSGRAIDLLIRKSQWYKEPLEIHLLNVQLPIASGEVKLFVSQEQINAFHHDEGLKALESARAKLDAAGIAYKFHVVVGDPSETIARYAKENGCEQIFMGTRGMGAISNLFMGSVATKVIHLAELPVMLVK